MTALLKLANTIVDAEVIEYTNETKKAWLPPLESAVIYNKFDIQSIMAAAVYSGRTSNTTKQKYQLFDTTVILNTHFNEYIWIGVKPDTNPRSFLHATIRKETKHIKLDDGYNSHKHTIYEEAIKQTGGDVGSAYVLANILNNFYTNKLNIEELIFIYKNYIKALDCIEQGTIFEPEAYSDNIKEQDKVNFLIFINKVKGKLKHNYKVLSCFTNNRKINYCLLALNITHYSWAIRLVKMSYSNYLNVINTLRGYAVDTNIANLRDTKVINDNYTYTYLNSY